MIVQREAIPLSYFLSHRGTPSHPPISRDFPWNKPASYWGTPMATSAGDDFAAQGRCGSEVDEERHTAGTGVRGIQGWRWWRRGKGEANVAFGWKSHLICYRFGFSMSWLEGLWVNSSKWSPQTPSTFMSLLKTLWQFQFPGEKHQDGNYLWVYTKSGGKVKNSMVHCHGHIMLRVSIGIPILVSSCIYTSLHDMPSICISWFIYIIRIR